MEANVLDRIRIKKIGLDKIDEIHRLNMLIFQEKRLINTLDHDYLLIVGAELEGELVGFKIGYDWDDHSFYSAKGGVLPHVRRNGIARKLMFEMMNAVENDGFTRFLYHTFPNTNPGMLIMGLENGFKIQDATWNEDYQDFQLRLERDI